MAISTLFQMSRFSPGPTITPRLASPQAGFQDHFVAFQPEDLVLRRPNFQAAAPAVSAELKLGGWQSELSSLTQGQAAGDSSWVREHRDFERKCYFCDGSGKCQHDDVAGSGKINGEDDNEFCSGTGKCEHCGGDGDMGN